IGDLREAEKQWRRIVEERPHYRMGWRGLGEVLVRQRRAAEAEALARRIEKDPRLESEASLLLSRVAEVSGDTMTARRHLEHVVGLCPNDPDILHALCRFLFERMDVADAEAPLRQLLALHPQDASLLHNLGLVHVRQGRLPEAIADFKQSLQLRP